MSVATSLRLRRKTEKNGTRNRKRHEIVYVLSERLEQATFMPTSFPGFSPIHPTEQGENPGNEVAFMPAARLGKQCLLQQTLPCLNSFTFSAKLSRCNASLCTRCFRYFSSFHFFTHRYVHLENHFRARQNRSTGNPTLHQETSTSVWSALIALRDKSLLSRAAALFHTELQFTVYNANLVKRTQTAMAKSNVKHVGCASQGKP